MSDTAFVLITTPDASTGQALTQALQKANPPFRLATSLVETGAEAVGSLKVRAPDVVVIDFALTGDVDAPKLLRESLRLTPHAQVVVLARDGAQESLRKALGDDRRSQTDAMDGGVYECLIDPPSIDVVADVVGRAARQALATRETQMLREQVDRAFDFEGLVGVSEAMLKVIKRARKLAGSKCTVLITGETGTGKELLAQAIHAASPRAGRPFKPLNCAADVINNESYVYSTRYHIQ